MEDIMNDLAPLVERTQQLYQQAYIAIAPEVDRLCQETKSENEVTYCLDRLLDFADDERVLGLYKRLCRQYAWVYPQTILDYIQAYLEMWDDPERYYRKSGMAPEGAIDHQFASVYAALSLRESWTKTQLTCKIKVDDIRRIRRILDETLCKRSCAQSIRKHWLFRVPEGETPS